MENIEGQQSLSTFSSHAGVLVEFVSTTSSNRMSSFDVIQLADSNWLMTPKMENWFGAPKKRDNMGTFKIMRVCKPKQIEKNAKKKLSKRKGTKRLEKRN